MNAKFTHFLGAVALVSVVLSASAEANAPAGRYTIAGGTVTDTKTKLTWQQTAPSVTYAWADAKTYCQSLSLAGTGWRLPTIKELQTIIDYSQSSHPMIDPTAFPAALGDSPYFWSSTSVAGSPTKVWIADFYYGTTAYYHDSIFSPQPPPTPEYVRCVR